MRGTYTKIGDEILVSVQGLLADEGICCAKCKEIVVRLPDDVVDLLKTEETWGPCCDSLRSHLGTFIKAEYTKAHSCVVHC